LSTAESRAAQSFEKYSKAAPDWARRFRLLQAELLLRLYRVQDAMQLLDEVGASLPAQGDEAIKFNLLYARAHSRLKKTDLAARELSEARRLAETTHSRLMGQVLQEEALQEREGGHPDQALEKFHLSFDAARQNADLLTEAVDFVDISQATLQSRHFEEALRIAQEAVAFTRSIQARRQLQIVIGNMGWAYQNLGDFELALANFQEAEGQARELGATSYDVIWLQDAGLAAYRLGQLELAREYDEDALKKVLTLPPAQQTRLPGIETNLALLLYQQGQYPQARRVNDDAMRDAKDAKDVDVMAYSRVLQGLLEWRLDHDAEAERIFNQIVLETTDADIRTDAQDALANLYASRHDNPRAGLWYRRAVRTFEAKRAGIHSEALRLSTFGYGDAVYRDYANFLITNHRSNEALDLLDRSRARTLEEGLGGDASHNSRSARSTAAQAVARRLNAIILFYSLGPEQSHLWVIDRARIQTFDLPKESDLQTWIGEYQKAIQKSIDPLRTPVPAAALLYDALLKPAADSIPQGSRVFIIPDGVLHGLNFETLPEPTSAGPRYWIERVTVNTGSSISLLARASAADNDAVLGHRLLLIGDPLPGHSEFQPLPNAADEIDKVGRHFPQQTQTVLTRDRAVPTAYADSHPDQYQYIHFVAHGTASRLVPLDSAVVLSPERGHPESFKLYARDIAHQPLTAELVTISACYGSGIRAYAGEGLVGLAWVFLRAGSHNVIGALWQASDASTPVLMDHLYEGIQAGKSPDIALRDAKLALIRSPNVYRKPFYWGAFQLYAGS
jgi:CHAT domain-containing protein